MPSESKPAVHAVGAMPPAGVSASTKPAHASGDRAAAEEQAAAQAERVWRVEETTVNCWRGMPPSALDGVQASKQSETAANMFTFARDDEQFWPLLLDWIKSTLFPSPAT